MTETPPTEIERRPLRTAPSLVLVNTGDGKGKSTAAFGTALRALAQGWKVAVVQFLKSGEWKVGEQKIAEQLGVAWHTLGDGFSWDSEDLEASAELARAAWGTARRIIEGGDHRLVILDEVTYPMTWGWIDTAEVVAAISGRPRHVNVILTGRDAPQEIVDAADTVTEMRSVKHAFDSGIAAKKGIDY